MGAAQDRARPKNQLVMACSYRVPDCAHPTRADLRSTDHVDSYSALFGSAIDRHFFNYGGPHPNLDLFFLRQVLSSPDRSSSHPPSRPGGSGHGRCLAACGVDAPRGAGRAVRLTRVPVNCRTLLLVFLRKCDETVSYHLYIVTRYLWVLVPHTIRICL